MTEGDDVTPEHDHTHDHTHGIGRDADRRLLLGALALIVVHAR